GRIVRRRAAARCARPGAGGRSRHHRRRRADRESRRGHRSRDHRLVVPRPPRARHHAHTGDPRQRARGALRPRAAHAFGPHRGDARAGAVRGPNAMNALLAVRLAWRDLRGGSRGFGVFIAAIALGVMAIAGVGSVAASLADGIAGAGQTILGGDLSFALVQRQASDTERAFLSARGTVSSAALLRAMARSAGGETTLVEVKAVDGAYPLFGTLATDPAMPVAALLAQHDGAFGAAVDPALLARLNLTNGDRISIGTATIELRAALTNEPDRLAGGIGFGPRVLISDAALQATGLVQPGSLVRWLYRLRLPEAASSDAAVASVKRDAQANFPDAGWDIRSRDKASPQLERNVERFSEFLALVALATLLVGGVGNAVAAHLARKRDAIGTLKALGASGSTVFAVYCAEIVLVALFAAAIGAAIGAALPFAIASWFGAIIPLPVMPSLHPLTLALSIGYGLIVALAFALWPLGRAHDTPVAMLFRDQVSGERRWPRPRSTALRLALANVHRPGALTPTIMLSLGLGLALLTTVIEIDGNLH